MATMSSKVLESLVRSARAIKSGSYGCPPDSVGRLTFRRSRYEGDTRSRWLRAESSRASRRQRKRLTWTRAPRTNGTLARTGEKWKKCQPRKLQRTAVTSALLHRVVNSTSENVTVHPTSWWPGAAERPRESHIACASRADRRQQGPPRPSSWCDPHLMRPIIESR